MENIPFNIYNRNCEEIMPAVGYNIPSDVFRFVANFTTSGSYISDKKVLWSFGDGTTSSNLTAFHNYGYAGFYPVTLTVFLSNGDATVSTYLSTIQINNFVNDCIIITSDNVLSQISGNLSKPIMVTRYNSLANRNSTVLNLAVSGNRSEFVSADTWYKNKNIHLESTARFLIDTDKGLTVVDTLTTTNDTLYASLNGSTYVLTTSAGAINTAMVGSSGYAYFYYVEDYKL